MINNTLPLPSRCSSCGSGIGQVSASMSAVQVGKACARRETFIAVVLWWVKERGHIIRKGRVCRETVERGVDEGKWRAAQAAGGTVGSFEGSSRYSVPDDQISAIFKRGKSSWPGGVINTQLLSICWTCGLRHDRRGEGTLLMYFLSNSLDRE